MADQSFDSTQMSNQDNYYAATAQKQTVQQQQQQVTGPKHVEA
jgi:hypothetical protein